MAISPTASWIRWVYAGVGAVIAQCSIFVKEVEVVCQKVGATQTHTARFNLRVGCGHQGSAGLCMMWTGPFWPPELVVNTPQIHVLTTRRL